MIKIAEALPHKGAQLGRTGSLAEYMSKNGHHVTWWNSTFLHIEKKLLSTKTTIRRINKNERIISLHSPIIYAKNVSIRRIIFYKILSIKFRKLADNMRRPDIILCSWPSMLMTDAILKYGKKNNVPVIIDARDQWPDIFERALPKPLKKIALIPLQRYTKRLFSEASGIASVQKYMLEWACAYAERKPSNNDKYFYLGAKINEILDKKNEELEKWWKDKGIDRDTWNLCFWGSLRHSGLDLECVIRAVKKLELKYPDIRLVIGGDGDSRKQLEEVAGDSKSIIFAGYLNGYQMTSAMRISKLGIYSIINTKDFVNTISNKAFQYMSEGLPILNSLTGFTKSLLEENDAGVTYQEGNVDDCMRKIEDLYLNENRREIMAKNAKKLFDEQFESDKINEEFMQYLIDMSRKDKVS